MNKYYKLVSGKGMLEMTEQEIENINAPIEEEENVIGEIKAKLDDIAKSIDKIKKSKILSALFSEQNN